MKRGCLILLRVCARVRVCRQLNRERERERERAGKFTLTKPHRLFVHLPAFSCLVSVAPAMPRCRPETRLWPIPGPCHPAEKVVWVKVKNEFADSSVTEYVAVKWEKHRRAVIAHSLRRAGGSTARDNAVAVVVNSTAVAATNNDSNEGSKKVKVKNKNKNKKKKTVKKERPHNRFRHLLRDAKAIAMARIMK